MHQGHRTWLGQVRRLPEGRRRTWWSTVLPGPGQRTSFRFNSHISALLSHNEPHPWWE